MRARRADGCECPAGWTYSPRGCQGGREEGGSEKEGEQQERSTERRREVERCQRRGGGRVGEEREEVVDSQSTRTDRQSPWDARNPST